MRVLSDHRLVIAALVGLLAPACARDDARDTERVGHVAQALAGNLSVTSGVHGTVTTLATYSGGGAHPGVNAVDIGAAGGTSVWHQLDYLPADIAGGWVRTFVTKDAGYCSQWSPGSPYYNGAKLIVVTYFYGTDGSYRGWHRSAYQHVAPDGTAANHWWKWNNPAASQKAWGAADVELGTGTSSGIYLGTVFAVWGSIYNGPNGGLCTTGSHLHQEGDGVRAGTLWVGKSVGERYSDIHRFGIAGGTPSTGSVPSPPTFDPKAPEPAPEEPAETPPDPEEPPDPSPASGQRADFAAERERRKAEHEGAAPAPAPHEAPLGEGASDAAAASDARGCSVRGARARDESRWCAALVLALLVYARRRTR